MGFGFLLHLGRVAMFTYDGDMEILSILGFIWSLANLSPRLQFDPSLKHEDKLPGYQLQQCTFQLCTLNEIHQ